MNVAVEVFSDSACELGEGPVWSESLQGLFWLDILRQRLYFKHASGSEPERCWLLPCICSAIFLLPESTDEVLLLSESGLARYSLVSEKFDILAKSHDESTDMRPNDAGVDPAGRVWFGTMQKQPAGLFGALYCVGGDYQIQKKRALVGIPNTFVWSADGYWMIHADSMLHKIFRSRYDAGSANLYETSEIVDLASENIDPDGSAVDQEDRFWNAQWGGARVVCYDMNGHEHGRITVPALQPTSCAFGGKDLMTLYITSAIAGLDVHGLTKHPLSGRVFRVQVTVPGRRLPECCLI